MINFNILDNDPRLKELAKEKAELNAQIAEIARQEARIIYELTTTPEQREHQRRVEEAERQRQIDISLGRDATSLQIKANAEENAKAREAEEAKAQQNNANIKRRQDERAEFIRTHSPR